ncbi:MAG TPA: YeeE/YedE thiosulfate transporter family protein [Rhodothermales bacterium]|nr:transporter [Bacteroidota bacterium]HRK73876.1 YeeE/YedE thiosulfate transporter family protein [Rhodothermales bacterium]HRR09734.1 YeeE/YedE thiosulfate transporter family protein [Rhodothermales bacterium]
MWYKSSVFRWVYYLLVGVWFGIVMTKSEAVSWFRIQEMFHFQSFHMYGIIGTAVGFGALFTFLMKRFKAKDVFGNVVVPEQKVRHGRFNARYLIGGTLFGLGWALTGACPGPVFVLVGHGIWSMTIVIVSALIGTKVFARFHGQLVGG